MTNPTKEELLEKIEDYLVALRESNITLDKQLALSKEAIIRDVPETILDMFRNAIFDTENNRAEEAKKLQQAIQQLFQYYPETCDDVLESLLQDNQDDEVGFIPKFKIENSSLICQYDNHLSFSVNLPNPQNIQTPPNQKKKWWKNLPQTISDIINVGGVGDNAFEYLNITSHDIDQLLVKPNYDSITITCPQMTITVMGKGDSSELLIFAHKELYKNRQIEINKTIKRALKNKRIKNLILYSTDDDEMPSPDINWGNLLSVSYDGLFITPNIFTNHTLPSRKRVAQNPSNNFNIHVPGYFTQVIEHGPVKQVIYSDYAGKQGTQVFISPPPEVIPFDIAHQQSAAYTTQTNKAYTIFLPYKTTYINPNNRTHLNKPVYQVQWLKNQQSVQKHFTAVQNSSNPSQQGTTTLLLALQQPKVGLSSLPSIHQFSFTKEMLITSNKKAAINGLPPNSGNNRLSSEFPQRRFSNRTPPQISYSGPSINELSFEKETTVKAKSPGLKGYVKGFRSSGAPEYIVAYATYYTCQLFRTTPRTAKEVALINAKGTSVIVLWCETLDDAGVPIWHTTTQVANHMRWRINYAITNMIETTGTTLRTTGTKAVKATTSIIKVTGPALASIPLVEAAPIVLAAAELCLVGYAIANMTEEHAITPEQFYTLMKVDVLTLEQVYSLLGDDNKPYAILPKEAFCNNGLDDFLNDTLSLGKDGSFVFHEENGKTIKLYKPMPDIPTPKVWSDNLNLAPVSRQKNDLILFQGQSLTSK